MQAIFFMRRIVPRLLAILFLGLAGAAQAVAAPSACGALDAAHAWVRVLPGAPVAAGYFELHNTGDAAIDLTAVSSPQFGRVEMHRSMVDTNGMATMKPVDAVTVPPGETVTFAPGSYHLMLFESARKLAPGDTVTLELQCGDSGTPSPVEATVRDMMPMEGNHMNMHHDN